MAAHESPRTTKFYGRTKERLTQKEVESFALPTRMTPERAPISSPKRPARRRFLPERPSGAVKAARAC
jgi:hypothetical protein